MSLIETNINISDYIELYNRGKSVKDFTPINNQTYYVLRMSTVDIRVIDREECYDILVKLEKIKHFTVDTKSMSARYFYMIPIQTIKGTIVGFIFRTLEGKRYNSVLRDFSNFDNKVPIMFGFSEGFENFDKHKKSVPLVICEGLKDCIILKKMYPYVLSNNTSSLGFNAYVLRNLTDKFILCYDNDETGREKLPQDVKILQSLGCSVDTLVTPMHYKDCSDLISNKRLLKIFKNDLVRKVYRLMA